jgi:hypothetical protein
MGGDVEVFVPVKAVPTVDLTLQNHPAIAILRK